MDERMSSWFGLPVWVALLLCVSTARAEVDWCNDCESRRDEVAALRNDIDALEFEADRVVRQIRANRARQYEIQIAFVDLLQVPDSERDDKWHITWLLLEFEHSVLAGANNDLIDKYHDVGEDILSIDAAIESLYDEIRQCGACP